MKTYKMTQEERDEIMHKIRAARNAPLIMLQCGMPRSAQEVANDCWAELGKKYGFDHMTARPIDGMDSLHFKAEELTNG